MIVAITGGTGFIGKRLVARHIARGDKVRLLTRKVAGFESHPLLEVRECDLLIASPAVLASHLQGVDVIYHCAGQLTDVQSMRALHVDATRKLAEAAAGLIGHWVQLSSVGVYGPVKSGVVTEDSRFNPIGEYEITKAESDKIVVDAASNGAFSYSILRPSNVFGAGMTNQSLFAMVSMIERGLFFFIGRPGASANYIHVDNVVEGLIRCGTMQQAKGRTYNLSDHCTLEHFVDVIAKALGHSSPRIRIPEPVAQLVGATLGSIPGFPLTRSRVDALIKRSEYSTDRIRQELGYQTVVSIDDGLRELVEEYKLRSR
jgi:nucleoside-diphosphate-sugar epimerase